MCRGQVKQSGRTPWRADSLCGVKGFFKLCFSSFAPRQIEQSRLHSVLRRLSGLTSNVPEAGIHRQKQDYNMTGIGSCQGGYDAHVKRNKIRKSNYLQSIIGKLNFWLMVEPQNETAKKGYEYLYPIYKERIVNYNG